MITAAQIKHTFTFNGCQTTIYLGQPGQGIPRHEHVHNHGIACVAGSIAIRKENIEVTLDLHTQPVNVLPNAWHEIEILEPDTVFMTIGAVQSHNQ